MSSILRRRFSNPLAVGMMFATTIVMAIGCGGAADGYKGAYGSVTGKVTYKGQPVPNCIVLFQAEKGGHSGSGKTNDKGEYTLTSPGGSKLPAVKYGIQLGVNNPGGPPPMDPAKSAEAVAPPAAPFPIKYTSVGSSGLEFTIKDGANTANFDLTD